MAVPKKLFLAVRMAFCPPAITKQSTYLQSLYILAYMSVYMSRTLQPFWTRYLATLLFLGTLALPFQQLRNKRAK